MTRLRFPALRTVSAVLLAAALVALPVPGAAAAAGASPATGVGVAVAPVRLTALPGFRSTSAGAAQTVQRFTSVARLAISAAVTARTVVLSARVSVVVPGRTALSLRGSCAGPSGTRLPDVLIVGQNPLPGTATARVASRTLTGRAIVELPAGQAVRCLLEVSPQTEAFGSSWLAVRSGTFSATPVVVLARAYQRPGVLVGTASAPGSGHLARPVRQVSVVRAFSVPVGIRLRVEGEAELTTCALGYHLCATRSKVGSVADVALELAEIAPSGRVCRRLTGAWARVVIDPGLHHLKVVVPSLQIGVGCGTALSAWLVVRYRSGSAVEVEPLLVPASVQTHLWVQLQ